MDRWYEKDPLVVAFLELFFIASNKDAWVDQLWDQVGEVGCWNLVFTR